MKKSCQSMHMLVWEHTPPGKLPALRLLLVASATKLVTHVFFHERKATIVDHVCRACANGLELLCVCACHVGRVMHAVALQLNAGYNQTHTVPWCVCQTLVKLQSG